MKYLFIYLLMFLPLTGQLEAKAPGAQKQPPSHQLWDELLKKWVNDEGLVNYGGFIRDKAKLETYLHTLSSTPPDKKSWSEAEQMAYWINAYNAVTVKLIADHYPLKSIEDLNTRLKLPQGKTIWQQKLFKTGGRNLSLDDIEHQVLRKEFDEPRIHFAVNCASISCPPLRREAFTAQQLNRQLEEQAVNFINDPKYNRLSSHKAEVSKVFSWFKEDFTKHGDLLHYLNRYANTKLKPAARIGYLEYDWGLNKQ